MAKEQWDVRSNLKNKPNAQGTLFSGGAAQMNPEKRYKKGYTPERMRDVEKNTVVEGWQTGNLGQYKTTRHDVLQTLARSTAPASDMHGLGIRVEHPEVAKADGIAGDYLKGGGHNGHARIALGSVHDSTVIHELGHHVSAQQFPEYHETNTPYDRGHEEGFADAYADKHFVEHPQAKKLMLDDSRRGTLEYAPNRLQTRDHTGTPRPEEFSAGYNAMRPEHTRVPNTADHDTEDYERRLDEHYRPTLPGMPAVPYPKPRER